MHNGDYFYEIVQKISRRGISHKCRALVPQIIREYLKNYPKDEILKRYGRRNKKCVEKIYERAENIYLLEKKKEAIFEKIKGIDAVLVKHPKDVLGNDIVFADMLLRFIYRYRKEMIDCNLSEIMKKNGVDEDFLRSRYKENKNVPDQMSLLLKLGRDRHFLSEIEKKLCKEIS